MEFLFNLACVLPFANGFLVVGPCNDYSHRLIGVVRFGDPLTKFNTSMPRPTRNAIRIFHYPALPFEELLPQANDQFPLAIFGRHRPIDVLERRAVFSKAVCYPHVSFTNESPGQCYQVSERLVRGGG